jgi:predicted molibdopterin-dependent oxidoreductase YjgC
MNLEGRIQRLRRAVPPPCPDELAWIAKLAARFGVDLAPHTVGVFDELAGHLFRDLSLDDLGLHAPLPARHSYTAPPAATIPEPPAPSRHEDERFVGALVLHRSRSLFSGPSIERVPELAFQRPEREIELSPHDAERRGIAAGDTVVVSSNGTSIELRARLNRRLVEGVACIPDEHAADLHAAIEVVRAQ